MPLSKHRKNHKQKVNQYKESIQAGRRKWSKYLQNMQFQSTKENSMNAIQGDNLNFSQSFSQPY